MTRPVRYARLGLAALGPLVLAAWVAAAPSAQEGWTFSWKVTGEGPGQRNATMQVRVLGNRVRMDYRAGDMPGMTGEGFMLLDAHKGQMTLVSAQDRTAIVMDAEGWSSAFNSLSAAGINMRVKDASSSVDDLGPGERLLGHATRKYRVRQGYTVEVSAMGFNRAMTMRDEIELWMATDFAPPDQKAFEEFGKRFAGTVGRMGAVGGEAMQKMAEELQAKMPRGFPLKQVQTSIMTDDGRSTTSRSTMEVTSLSKTDLDASIFQVPPGYTVRSMSEMMQQRQKPPR